MLMLPCISRNFSPLSVLMILIMIIITIIIIMALLATSLQSSSLFTNYCKLKLTEIKCQFSNQM